MEKKDRKWVCELMEQYWITSNEKRILVCDLEDSHITNICSHFHNKEVDFSLGESIDKVLREAKYRHMDVKCDYEPIDMAELSIPPWDFD
jgi:hypothetical protein